MECIFANCTSIRLVAFPSRPKAQLRFFLGSAYMLSYEAQLHGSDKKDILFKDVALSSGPTIFRLVFDAHFWPGELST